MMVAAETWCCALLVACFVLALESASGQEHLNCPAPRSPENGLSFIFNNGRMVRFRCLPGYVLRGHGKAVCVNNQWNHPTPLCIRKHGRRRGALASDSHHDRHHNRNSSRNLFQWRSSRNDSGDAGSRLPLINGQWKRDQTAYSVIPLSPRTHHTRQRERGRSSRDRELIDQEVGIAELRHRQEQEVRGNHVEVDSDETTPRAPTEDTINDILDDFTSTTLPTTTETPEYTRPHHHHSHSVATSRTANTDDSNPSGSRRYYAWRSQNPHHSRARYYSSRTASSGGSSARPYGASIYSSHRQHHRYHVSTETTSPIPTQPLTVRPTLDFNQTREALRQPSDISDYWRRLSGYSSYRYHSGSDNRFENRIQEARRRPVQVMYRRSHVREEDDDDDDYEDGSDESGRADSSDDDRNVRVTFVRPTSSRRGDTGPDPDERRSQPQTVTSRPFDYFGRPVQVMTGEKAAQAEALLRQQYERAQAHRRQFEEARAPPVSYDRDPPQNTEKGWNQIRQRYEYVDERLRAQEEARSQLQEARAPPVSYDRQPARPPSTEKGIDQIRQSWAAAAQNRQYEEARAPPESYRQPPSTEKGIDQIRQSWAAAAQNRQYEEARAPPVSYRQPPSTEKGLDQIRNQYDNLAELRRRPDEEVTSSPFDHYGRPVQVLRGEKAAQQDALIRQQYQQAEARRRPEERVYRHPDASVTFDREAAHPGDTQNRNRRHRHRHGDAGDESESQALSSEELSSNVPLSDADIELLNRLSPELRASYIKEIQKARSKEETAPERANDFLSRYESTWKRRAAALAQDSQEEQRDQPNSSDNDDESTDEDSDDDDDEEESVSSEDDSSTTASTEVISSTEEVISEEKQDYWPYLGSTYDQSCLQDKDEDRKFIRAPKLNNTHVYRYERKKHKKPPHTYYVLARYRCNRGYEMFNKKANALFCRKRKWVGELPLCLPEDR